MATPKENKLLKYLLIILLIIFPIGQLTRIPLPLKDINIYLHDLVLAFLWLILISTFLRGIKIFSTPITGYILIFISWLIVSFLINLYRLDFWEGLISSSYLLRFAAFTAIFFALNHLLEEKILSSEKIKDYILTSIFVTSLFAILQYIFYPDLRNLYYLGWDPHYLRAFGTFFDPNFLGLLLVTALLIIINTVNWQKNWGYILKAVVIFITMALTYSRSSYLAFIGGIIYFSIMKKAWKLLLTTFAVIIITLFLLPQSQFFEGRNLLRISSTISRLGSWQESIDLIKKSPIIGLGFNTLRYTRDPIPEKIFDQAIIPNKSASGIENSFLFVAVTSGVIGLILFLFLLFDLFSRGDLLLKIMIIAISVHSLFNNSFFYPWVMLLFWIMVALGIKDRNSKA